LCVRRIARGREGHVPSRGNEGRGRIPVAKEKGAEVSGRPVGRIRDWRRGAGRRRAGRTSGVVQQPPPWLVAESF